MANIYEMVDTWNNSGVTYTSIKMDITDTASASGSKIIDLKIDGVTKFDVDKNGNLGVTGHIVASGRLRAKDGTTGDVGIGFGTDHNVGLIRPAADTLGIVTTSQERMRIDSSGRLGVGTTSPAYDLHIGDGTANVTLALQSGNTSDTRINMGDAANAAAGSILYANSTNKFTFTRASFAAYEISGAHTWYVGGSGTRAMDLNASGNLGIGTTSPESRLTVSRLGNDWSGVSPQATTGLFVHSGTTNTTSAGSITLGSGNQGTGGVYFADTDDADVGAILYSHPDDDMQFRVGNAERMRIDSSGNLLVGRSTTGASTADYGHEFFNTGVLYHYANASGTADGYRMYGSSGTVVCRHYGNGGIANFSANDVNLSDPRSKKDIQNSSKYLSKLCSIPVMNYRYKHEESTEKHHLGVLTTDVEAVAPELVNKNSWEYNEQKLDAIFEGDLKYAMLKAIQEQQEIIESLKSRIEQLEGAN